MTDPGGGYGWRSSPHLPRRRGGVLGWGQIARSAELLGQDRPLCLLLLPAPLEAFALRERAEDLLRAPGVAAVDPPRLSYARAARLGQAFADGIALVQAKRMRLPGIPRALVLFDPLEYPLARSLASIHPDAELWYGPREIPDASRELHDLALARASLRFDPEDDYRPLWERMERLGIESGRLGSERPDVMGS